MTTTPSKTTVCYPSGPDLRPFHRHFVAVADGTPLPDDIADLVTATVVHENGKTIVRVEFV